jgi:ArsR family transcriptional regulator
MKNEYLRVFRAFSDENRVRILELLCKGEQCACVLLDDLDIGQPTLSHHMKILCESGIVSSRRDGRWNYYSINTEGCEYGGLLLNALIRHNMGGVVSLAKIIHFLPLLRGKTRGRGHAGYGAVEEQNCCCSLKPGFPGIILRDVRG